MEADGWQRTHSLSGCAFQKRQGWAVYGVDSFRALRSCLHPGFRKLIENRMYHLAPTSCRQHDDALYLRRSDSEDGAGPRWGVECCNCLAPFVRFLSNSTHEKVPPRNCNRLCPCGIILWGDLCWCYPVQRLQNLPLLSLLS
jgi:hypothetical protein